MQGSAAATLSDFSVLETTRVVTYTGITVSILWFAFKHCFLNLSSVVNDATMPVREATQRVDFHKGNWLSDWGVGPSVLWS